ncbi:MAG: hypothetical protein IJ498_01355 [Akkermansia sp.]|nr:hypothetical protein [Akkermansia sp.]
MMARCMAFHHGLEADSRCWRTPDIEVRVLSTGALSATPAHATVVRMTGTIGFNNISGEFTRSTPALQAQSASMP